MTDHPYRDMLMRWAEENDKAAADLRIIAKTDPARKKPALQAARRHEQAARDYRAAVTRYEQRAE